MKDQFCWYEISLKLRKLGFNEDCLACFTAKADGDDFSWFWWSDQIWGNSELHPNPRFCKNSDFGNDKSCAAPLWQQAIHWIYLEYGVHVPRTDRYLYISELLDSKL
jgi:hypothetical protein